MKIYTKKARTKRCKIKVLTTGGKVLTTGGKVLTSGGFGCLFKPALTCKNRLPGEPDVRLNKNMVTKLMTKRHAKDEYKQINKFKTILDHIPNYQDYFLVDGFSICEPAELTSDDIEDFDDNCSALKKKNFKGSNINQNLGKILALNMPDGGIDVDEYVLAIKEKSELARSYLNLNKSLIDLLVNGIKPMNNARLYHCDVKGSNILVSESESIMSRLIDWGLSIYQKDTIKRDIPDKLDRRPFQFNVPFSVILFNKKFIEKYALFIKRHNTIDYYSIREFVLNYIFYWNKIRGAGHLKTINSIIKRLTYGELPAIENAKIKNHVIEYDFTYYYIVEYISKILFKYTNKNNGINRLDLFDYLHDIFLKNIDVWGFTMLYMVFLDNLYEVYEKNMDKMTAYHTKFIEKIKYIIIHFLFENPTEVIDINKLATELQSLNGLIEKFDSVENEVVDENKVDYLLSLTKIENADVKEIGGSLDKMNGSNKRKRYNKGKNKTKRLRK